MNANQGATDWRSIAIVYAAGAVAALALLKASPAALDLRAGLGLSLSQVAWISSIFTLTTVALGLFVGRWVARFGARNLAAGGLLVMAIAGSATLFAIGPLSLLVGRFIEGIGFVLVVVSAPTLMASLADSRHSRLVLAIWATWLPAGGVFILLAAPLLLGWGGWQALWLCSVAAALVAFLLLTRVSAAPLAGDAPRVELGPALGRLTPWLLALAFALFTVQLYSVLMFAPVYLVEQLHFSVGQSTFIASVVLMMAVPAGLLGGGALHRGIAPNRLMAIAFMLVGALVPCLVLFADSGYLALGLLVIYGLCAGTLPPCIYAQAPAAAYVPAATGIILGLVMAGNGLGILIGPPILAGVIEKTASWPMGALVPVAASVGGLACAVALSRLNAQPADR
ncbi:MAG: MFS transporter [Gammaproteobacteria bacterium]